MKTDLPVVTAVVSQTGQFDALSLRQNNDYPVIEIFDDYYRIVDELGDPILYPKNYFIDCEIPLPDGWLCRHDEYGESQLCPPEFSQRAFFDFHSEGDPEMIRKFREFCNNHGLRLPNGNGDKRE